MRLAKRTNKTTASRLEAMARYRARVYRLFPDVPRKQAHKLFTKARNAGEIK